MTTAAPTVPAPAARRATRCRRISIPLRAWGAILHRAGRHVLSDRLQVASAGIAFFAVLSIAPMLVTALSVYGAVNTPQQALEQMSGVAARLPPELRALVADQLTTITTASTQVHTFRGLTALVIALWTATTAATYLIDALTLAYHETETRGFLAPQRPRADRRSVGRSSSARSSGWPASSPGRSTGHPRGSACW